MVDYNKLVNNTNAIAGLEGLKKLLDCVWCVKTKRDAVLKFIANRYGFVSLPNKEDVDKLPKFIESKQFTIDNSSDSDRKLVAKKLGVPINKVKPAKDGFIVFGRKVLTKEVLGD